MATKTSNVTARVEPEVKEQAETILSDLGIPVSTASISSIGKLSFGTDCRFVPPFLQRGPNPEVK